MQNKRHKKNVQNSVKFPVIKDKTTQISALPLGKGVKLERIGQKKNMMLMDIVKINKI